MNLTSDKLEAWRGDVCRWAETNVKVQSPATGQVEPLRLADHQREFLQEATRRGADGRFVHRTCIASWPRREGKSLCVALLLAWRMTCWTNQRLLVLANSERQAASNVFAILLDILRLSPALEGFFGEENVTTTRIEVPALGNVVECLPCNWRTVQGRPRTDALACDELHAAENPKAFDFASNQLEGLDSQCLVSSQAGPPMESNRMWRMWEAREEGHLHFSYRQEHALPWAIALGKREKATLPGPIWAYMHENEWGQSGAGVFSAADVDLATMDYQEPQSPQEWAELRRRWGADSYDLGSGLDRAGVSRSGSRTVWCVTCRFRQGDGPTAFRVVRLDVLPTGAEGEVLDAVAETERIFGGYGRAMLEQYGCSDLLGRIPGATLEAPTSARQLETFTFLGRLLTEARIGFPASAGDGLLKEELLAFEMDVERGGLARFGVQGHSDDCVDALNWSVEALGKDRGWGMDKPVFGKGHYLADYA